MKMSVIKIFGINQPLCFLTKKLIIYSQIPAFYF